MPLPVLNPNADIRSITERINVLIRDYNREDSRVPLYMPDTGSATAYVIDPVPGAHIYTVGQIFTFTTLNANTGSAPTLNVNGLGAGTITLPDGTALITGDIAASALVAVQVASTAPTFHLLNPAPRILQTVSTFTGAVATGTTTVPYDDSVPDQSVPEGDQYMSLSITRKLAASSLSIRAYGNFAHSSATAVGIIMALFQDNTAAALKATAGICSITGGGQPIPLSIEHDMASGATGSTTFKVRAGSPTAGTTTFNGAGGARRFGGAYGSGIIITEYRA